LAPAGLTPAMYLRGKQEVPNPDPQSGLYIRDRRGNIVKVTLPADNIAFQVTFSTRGPVSSHDWQLTPPAFSSLVSSFARPPLLEQLPGLQPLIQPS